MTVWKPVLLVLIWTGLCSADESVGVRFFETAVRPLLADHCYACHGEDSQESDLRLDSLAGMLRGGKAGPAILPEQPDRSLLITAVRYHDSELRMPPDERLSDQQISKLVRWIKIGAPHPEQGSVSIQPRRGDIDLEAGRRHWAFQPIVRPSVPASSTSGNPIDAFVAQQLNAAAIAPLPRADKRTLIRRVTLDLIGLPPTPQEVADFLADDSPRAYRRLIDRLLASPLYGERWGRHWLDIARYADSNGLDENVAHGNAWRYRDYVVESLNNDKPYDQFLREQLAGDLLPAADDAQKHEQLIATGYLVLGPKVLAEVDESKMEMDIVDEQLDTVGRGLLGLTLGCARCHDHKFDPISQMDYYGLAGIFKSTKTMETFTKVAKWNEVRIATEDDLRREREWKDRLDGLEQQIERLLTNAKEQLLAGETGESKTFDETDLDDATAAKLKRLRSQLQNAKETAPVIPTAMAVSDGTIQDTAVHLRGSHLTLGKTVPRGFPKVLADRNVPRIVEDRSGRLALARWLTDDSNPLTARVIANRLWRWHFGKGLVATPDNFGLQGAPATHPELLDWLAAELRENRWSLKHLHRTIMMSETYQRRSDSDASAARVDPQNELYWRFDLRRLEAEVIRDALLHVSGAIDLQQGGSLLEVGNREYLFNHTSEDKSTYDPIRRRSLYVPVVRNHLYDFFQLFDYSDASMLNGDRSTSTIAPQALLMMNSPFVLQRSKELATRLLRTSDSSAERMNLLFELCLGRLPTRSECDNAERLLKRAAEPESVQAWTVLCQAVLASNEFVYLR